MTNTTPTMSITTSPLSLTARLDMVGTALLTLGEKLACTMLQLNGSVGNPLQPVSPQQIAEMTEEELHSNLKTNLLMVSPILMLLREVRDEIAEANGLSGDNQYNSAAYAAEQIIADL